MAKMFYTLEEAAEKLGKSQDEVRQMAKSGQLQEFRDRDKLMFKVEQVDLLTTDEEGGENDVGGELPLADDEPEPQPQAQDQDDEPKLAESDDEDEPALALDEPDSEPQAEKPPAAESGEAPSLGEEAPAGAEISLESESEQPAQQQEPSASGSGSGGAGRTGVSVFDADELEEADPSAVTQVTDEQNIDQETLDSVGSGSGLLDLTRESDDTSLGAEFLDEIYPGQEEEGGQAGVGGGGEEGPTTGLFESTGAEEEEPAAGVPAGVVAAEPLDGPGSGLAAGLSVGALIALALGLAVTITGLMETPGGLTEMVASNMMIVVASVAGVTLIGGVIGFFLGGRG